MTRYEQGFMNKCAEYGVDASRMIKQARISMPYKLKGFNIGDLQIGGAVGPGVNAVGVGSRNGGIMANISDTALHNGIVGSLFGVGAGMAHEESKDPEKRKNYLKSILIGLLAGGAVGVGATMVGNLPDYMKKFSPKGKGIRR